MKTIAAVITAVLMGATAAWAGSIGDAVEVRIVNDHGQVLPTYPVKTKHALKKVYAEAIKGDHYRIEVRNKLNRRVGVVIAVDGRNIVSGERSWLKNNERMYILDPYASGEFSGWRSSNDRINRFYFTNVPDSYAAAFGDESAMGVISVAAYPEVQRYQPPHQIQSQNTQPWRRFSGKGAASERSESAAGAAAPAPASEMAKSRAKAENKVLDSAGTGYGHEEYSPVQIVAFEAENRAVETIHFKYEWRETLCKLGVVNCNVPPTRRHANRLWDNGGYAPPPPRRW